MSEILIRVKNLTKQYPSAQFGGIKNISFDIKSGDIVAIIGESGSGKSTLLKSIYGLLKIDEGEILMANSKVLGPDEKLIPGHPQMKMVTQDFSLNTYAKVYDNIAAELPNTDLKSKADKTLAIMEHLRILNLKDKKIIELSGGEQQRVAIAKAMVNNTKVLLLDEPFSQVDALLKNQLRADIKRIVAETGLTVILVSHDPTDGLFLADQLLILRNGNLVQSGKPNDIYHQPTDCYTAQLLGNAVVLNQADAEKIGLKTDKNWVVFYPEWVELGNSWNGRRFEVKDVYFKGFFDEILLARNGITIRAIQLNGGVKKGDAVQVNVKKHLAF